MTAKVLKSDSVVVIGDHDPVTRAGVQAALHEAYEEGLAEGKRIAAEGLDDEIVRLRAALVDVDDRARTQLAASVRLHAEVMTRLAADLAAWFLDGAIAADPNVMLASLQGATAALADESEIVLHVHPEVAAALGDDHPVAVDAVRADASLQRADYRLVADGASIERRWSEAIAAITQELGSSLDADLDAAIAPGPGEAG